jgi:transcriptional regulator with XRE-family HTH domain
LTRGDKPPVCRKLGRVIRRARLRRDWSQETLAAKSGVAQSEISALESGGNLPRFETLERVARGLGCKLSRLIARAERLH